MKTDRSFIDQEFHALRTIEDIDSLDNDHDYTHPHSSNAASFNNKVPPLSYPTVLILSLERGYSFLSFRDRRNASLRTQHNPP